MESRPAAEPGPEKPRPWNMPYEGRGQTVKYLRRACQIATRPRCPDGGPLPDDSDDQRTLFGALGDPEDGEGKPEVIAGLGRFWCACRKHLRPPKNALRFFVLAYAKDGLDLDWAAVPVYVDRLLTDRPPGFPLFDGMEPADLDVALGTYRLPPESLDQAARNRGIERVKKQYARLKRRFITANADGVDGVVVGPTTPG